jgi:molybdopterin-guanine dinucleotide biosynthesis protein
LPRPFVISISGPGSGSGKTTLVCALIRGLVAAGKRTGAIKFATASGRICDKSGKLCGCIATAAEGTSRVETDPAITGRPGKDSGLMAAAGASPVWWVASARDCAVDAARDALARYATETAVDVVVCEGSGPARAAASDLHLMVAYGDGRAAKESAAGVAALAAAIVVNGDTGDGATIGATDATTPTFTMRDIHGPDRVRFDRDLIGWIVGQVPQPEHAA